MGKIAVFNIPAHGHTNPTLAVVRELVQRGHTVQYYSFDMFRSKIEAAGAQYISCDAWLPPQPDDFELRIRYDFASLIEMTTHVTVEMETAALRGLSEFTPDCIVADSMCIWGKLYAKKLGVPLVCSTTTFAFNEKSARLMRPSLREAFYSVTGMGRVNKCMKTLRQHGYAVGGLVDLIQNDNQTDTIVYTSKAFQPFGEDFGARVVFVGPSLPSLPQENAAEKARPLVYISLGSLLRDMDFYQHCVDALRDMPWDVVLSVGSGENAARLQGVPDNFVVAPRVQQLEVLQRADVFVTHCGMNSVSESLYFGVPMVLFPQHSEQKAVALRAQEVGAGIPLKRGKARDILAAVSHVMENRAEYAKCAERIAESFRAAGGAPRAADAIERRMQTTA